MLIPALHRLGCSYTKRGRVVYHNTLKLHFSRLHLPASGPQHTPYVSAPRRGGGAEGEKRQRRRDEEGKKKSGLRRSARRRTKLLGIQTLEIGDVAMIRNNKAKMKIIKHSCEPSDGGDASVASCQTDKEKRR